MSTPTQAAASRGDTAARSRDVRAASPQSVMGGPSGRNAVTRAAGWTSRRPSAASPRSRDDRTPQPAHRLGIDRHTGAGQHLGGGEGTTDGLTALEDERAQPARARYAPHTRALWPPPTTIASQASDPPLMPRLRASARSSSRAAMRPGAPMMPPPGCADEPHSQRSLTGVRKRAQPGAGRFTNSCSRDSSPWKMLPSVRPIVRSISRGVSTWRWRMRLRMFRRPLGDGVDHRIAERLPLVVPGPLRKVVRRVLHEAAHDVLAGRRHARVDERGDDHVDVRPPAEGAGLRVVVRLLHVVERGREADGAPQVLTRTGQAGEVGQAVEGEVDLAGRAAEPEAADGLLEVASRACPARAGPGR